MVKFIVNLLGNLPLVESVNPSLLRCGSIVVLNVFSKNVYEKQAFWCFLVVGDDAGFVGLRHSCARTEPGNPTCP